MKTTLRQLRNTIAQAGLEAPLSPKAEAQRSHILDAAEAVFAAHPRHTLTTTAIAEALRIAPRRLRYFFADPDALLAALLRRHLEMVISCLAALPAPTPPRLRAQAYWLATRTGATLSVAHRLYCQLRHTLPADERPAIETLRQALAETLGHGSPAILDLLDQPWLTEAQLDAALALAASAPTAEMGALTPPPPRGGPGKTHIPLHSPAPPCPEFSRQTAPGSPHPRTDTHSAQARTG